MQAINTPQVIKMQADDRLTIHVGNYRIHVLPSHKLAVSKTNLYGKQVEVHSEECDSHAEAVELAEEWLGIAIENETEWCDE